jgi:hypothetical protein
MYVIETWRFISQGFVACRALGAFTDKAGAVAAMWAEIHASGKDMSRFRIALGN